MRSNTRLLAALKQHIHSRPMRRSANERHCGLFDAPTRAEAYVDGIQNRGFRAVAGAYEAIDPR
jgi:hypothetical protein